MNLEWQRLSADLAELVDRDALVLKAIVTRRDDGMWRPMTWNGFGFETYHTAADDLQAARATLSAVLRVDVPEIPAWEER